MFWRHAVSLSAVDVATTLHHRNEAINRAQKAECVQVENTHIEKLSWRITLGDEKVKDLDFGQLSMTYSLKSKSLFVENYDFF